MPHCEIEIIGDGYLKATVYLTIDNKTLTASAVGRCELFAAGIAYAYLAEQLKAEAKGRRGYEEAK